MHAGAISVEDAYDLDVEIVLAMVVKKQCFGAALALIVARARTNRVDVAPIAEVPDQERSGHASMEGTSRQALDAIESSRAGNRRRRLHR